MILHKSKSLAAGRENRLATLKRSGSKDIMQRYIQPNGNKKHFGDTYYSGMWKGENCVIIGGGSSIREIMRTDDFKNMLKKYNTIGLNRAYHFFNNIDINLVLDYHLYKWIHEPKHIGKPMRTRFDNFPGTWLMLDMHNIELNNCYYFRCIQDEGLSVDLNRIYAYNNSGYCGINIAIALGCKRIFLFGFDMCEIEGRYYYHDYAAPKTYYKVLNDFNKGLQRFSGMLKTSRPDIEIYNVSPLSKLECFKKISFQEALRCL